MMTFETPFDEFFEDFRNRTLMSDYEILSSNISNLKRQNKILIAAMKKLASRYIHQYDKDKILKEILESIKEE